LKVSGVEEQSNSIYSVNPQNVDFIRSLRVEETESKEHEEIVSIEVKGGERGEREVEADENEWISEPEPGVLITLVQLPHGGNLLKKISFRFVLLINI
jgi:Transcription factor regulating root and shoot growth via Pin3